MQDRRSEHLKLGWRQGLQPFFQDLPGGPILDNPLAERRGGSQFGNDRCQQAIVIGE